MQITEFCWNSAPWLQQHRMPAAAGTCYGERWCCTSYLSCVLAISSELEKPWHTRACLGRRGNHYLLQVGHPWQRPKSHRRLPERYRCGQPWVAGHQTRPQPQVSLHDALQCQGSLYMACQAGLVKPDTHVRRRAHTLNGPVDTSQNDSNTVAREHARLTLAKSPDMYKPEKLSTLVNGKVGVLHSQ